MQTHREDNMIQCPYNKSHFIRIERLQVHLEKCRQNYPNTPKVVCPFNVSHRLNQPELDWHVIVCPQRSSFEKYKLADTAFTQTPAPPVAAISNDNEENWDNDPDVPTYNPQEYVSQAPVLRLLKGKPPSERKLFREKERLRFMEMKN